MVMILIEIDGEYGNDDPATAGGIHIRDDHGEIVMWDSQEWIDEPSVVFIIATAIQEALAEGKHATTASALRARLGVAIGDERFCQSHISCPDHWGALYSCGRYLNHKGWHVGGYEAIVTDPRPDLHRWNDTGRIEHI
jgi:hypothetical protein